MTGSTANIPDFRLTVGGQDMRGNIFDELAKLLDITDKVRPRLISLSLTEKRGGEADELNITLDDTNGNLDIPATGARLHLQLGWMKGQDVPAGMVDKGIFTVDETSHEGPPDQIVIRARSADFTGKIKERKSKSWHDTTLGAIVTEVAGRNGLKASCHPSLASIAVKSKAQSRVSDIAFLQTLGREHDAAATIKAGILIFSPIGVGTAAGGQPLPTLTLTRRDGDRHSFRIERRDDAGGVTATWHDRKAAKRKEVTVGKADGAKKLRKVYPDEEAARAAAKAQLGRSSRGVYSLDLSLALGRPSIYPEQKAKVSGFKGVIDEIDWLVEEVSHTLNKDSGFKTSLKLQHGKPAEAA